MRGLYDLVEVREESRSFLEDKFFKAVDNVAAAAVHYMLEKRTTHLPEDLRAGFARLLTGFFHRTPDRVAEIKALLLQDLEASIAEARIDPTTMWKPEALEHYSLEELERQIRLDIEGRGWGVSLLNVTDSEEVNTVIMRMAWTIFELDNTRHTLLTSDKPLVSTNGFTHYSGHLSVSLGPTRLFIATHNKETLDNITSVGPDKLVERFNLEVVKRAQKFVYGLDDKQLSFVEKWLTKTSGY